MSGNRAGPLAGYRPSGGPRNGIPGEKAYAYRGHPGWDPARGVHRDPSEVAPRDLEAEYEARLAEYARLKAERRTHHEIALRMEVSGSTVDGYARELRRRAAEAAGGAA